MSYVILSDGRFVKQESSDSAQAPRGDFVLQHHWWRGQIVIRFGASTQHWDLRFKKPDGSFIHFVLQDDPTQTDSIAAYLKPMESDARVTLVDGSSIDPMKIRSVVELKPEPENPESANPTKDTPAFLQTIAFGTALLLEDRDDFKKFDFHSQKFQGGWSAIREDLQSPFWEFRKSAGPKVKRVPIFKSDPEKHLIWGVVMEPLERDTQGHYTTADEIAEALHYYAIHWRLMDEQHERVLSPEQAVPVEFMQIPVDLEWPVGDSVYLVKAGSWVQVTYVPDPDLWRAIQSGEINAYSIRGWGKELRDPEST
jgi:hypothetical protein